MCYEHCNWVNNSDEAVDSYLHPVNDLLVAGLVLQETVQLFAELWSTEDRLTNFCWLRLVSHSELHLLNDVMTFILIHSLIFYIFLVQRRKHFIFIYLLQQQQVNNSTNTI